MTSVVSSMRRASQGPDAMPLVTIGMPVYNAEGTIEGAIGSMLQQTLTNFELIVSDNASTDRTWAILEALARRDPRVVCIRQPNNIGANGNYSAVFRRARAPYFKWASSNDWCDPEFLNLCVARLDAQPETVLVAPRTRLFSSSIDEFHEYDRDVAFDQAAPVDRFLAVGQSLALNNVLNGVARTRVLARTRLIEHYVGADVVLVAHLALLGKIELLEERLFYRRMDAHTATQMMSATALHQHHYPTRTWRSLFPAWRRVGGRLHAVLDSELSKSDTARALAWVLRSAYWSAPALGRDVIDTINFAIRRP